MLTKNIAQHFVYRMIIYTVKIISYFAKIGSKSPPISLFSLSLSHSLSLSLSLSFSLSFSLSLSLSLYPPSLSLSLCSRSNPNEGGRPSISAYWANYTQAQLGAMMATVPHCYRQLIFIEQIETILARPRKATPLPTCRFF